MLLLSLQEANSLKTTVTPTCVSKSRSASSASVCRLLRISRKKVISRRWNLKPAKLFVGRRRRTNRCTRSDHESNVHQRAVTDVFLPVGPTTSGRTNNSVSSSKVKDVLLPVGPTTSGRTDNSASCSTTARLPMPYKRDVSATCRCRLRIVLFFFQIELNKKDGYRQRNVRQFLQSA